MKKGIIITTIIMLIMGIFLVANKTYATDRAIDEQTESKIVEMKENATNSLEDYKVKCTCGHSVIIFPIDKKGYKICSWCGHKVYRDKQEQFKNVIRRKLNEKDI